MTRNLEDLTKEELLETVRILKRIKKFGLVWEDKPEEVVEMCRRELPVLEEVSERTITMCANAPTNIIIEGDNYHALSVLNYTHAGKIDLIYIDPPYNTGARDWKYNNDYVDANDTYRHSKWLAFMTHRLKLARGLLKPEGSVIIAIDDYEVHHLGVLLEELFPDYVKDLVIIEHHPQGAGSNTVSRTHEYAFIVTPFDVGFKGRKMREGEDSWSLKRSGQGENNWRTNRPKQFFAILVDPEANRVVGVGDEIPRDVTDYPTGMTWDGLMRIYPIDREGKERVWRYNRSTMQSHIKQGMIEYSSRGSLSVRKTNVNQVPVFSVWKGPRYNAGSNGTTLLTKIMGTTNTFPYPKSIWTTYDLLEIIVGGNREAVILDYFAGSGTTGHATLLLNDADDGNRQFILCTNNENGIAEDVTYPRIRNVINGYADVEGIPANVRYLRTDFVRKSKVSDDTRYQLVQRSTDMICVREDTYEPVADESDFKVFQNSHHTTAILYNVDALPIMKECLRRLTDKPAHIYVFSLTTDTYEEDFADLPQEHTLCPIPESILEVYRRTFERK